MSVSVGFRRRSAVVALSLAVASTGTGCATLLKIFQAATEPPTATFQAAELRGVSMEDATVAATFLVKNPNPVALSLEGLSWKFSLDGTQLLDGTIENGLRLPPAGSTALTVPIRIPFAALPNFLETFATKDEAPYAVKAVATVRTPIGNLSLPLGWEAMLPVPKLPTVSLATARVDEVTLLGAKMSVVLKVTNPNVFPLPLDALAGGIVVADRNVATLGLQAAQPLNAKQTVDITLPIAVSFASLGLAAATAISTGSATVGVKGDATFAKTRIPLDFKTTLSAR